MGRHKPAKACLGTWWSQTSILCLDGCLCMYMIKCVCIFAHTCIYACMNMNECACINSVGSSLTSANGLAWVQTCGVTETLYSYTWILEPMPLWGGVLGASETPGLSWPSRVKACISVMRGPTSRKPPAHSKPVVPLKSPHTCMPLSLPTAQLALCSSQICPRGKTLPCKPARSA